MQTARLVPASRWMRAANRLGAVLHPFGRRRPRFDAEILIAEARRVHGLHDFGPPPLREPLQRLLESLEREASLSSFGTLSARWDALRLLGNRLRLQRAFDRDPALADQPIRAPIVIAGLPRSGSTFLHRLLAQDPANRVPRHFEALFPVAPDHGTDRRRTRVNHQLALLRLLAPELTSLHPLTADTPQECTEVFSASFASLRFDTTYEIPTYRAWLDQRGAAEAYRFQRRVLQYLQGRDGDIRRWVLKSPDHVFTLPDLLNAYPDARLVITHRDPLQVVPSVARLTVVLRALFSDAIDPVAIGHTVASRWADGARRLVEAPVLATRSGSALHIHYREIVKDPLGTAARIYRHFGLALTQPAVAAMQRFLAAHRDGDYGNNRYRFEDYGFEAITLMRRFEDYMMAFGPAPEHLAWRDWQRFHNGYGRISMATA